MASAERTSWEPTAFVVQTSLVLTAFGTCSAHSDENSVFEVEIVESKAVEKTAV
jgi:hypothetical protein